MGALSHYIEREGIPTAQVSLIREQTAAIRPPRALWVPFMLGRPFGAPNAPDFQRKVLRALLALFERASGPVLEDFPDDAPAGTEDDAAFACPVSFAQAARDGLDQGSSLLREIDQLAPWYQLALRRRGRSAFGISGMSVEEAARHAASYLDGSTERAKDAPGVSAGMALKRACDDLKTYYYEAVAAQPGNLSAPAIEHWFWHDTAAGRAFLAIQKVCAGSDDKSLQALGKSSLVPRAIAHTIGEPRG